METTDPDHLIKILTLGDSGVGKTTFHYYFKEGNFSKKYIPSVGIDIISKQIVYNGTNLDGSMEPLGQRVHLQLWDTAGQERFRSLTKVYFRDAMGFLLMFDITHEPSFINIRSWIEQIEQHTFNSNPSILLIGHKSDMEEQRAVAKTSAIKLAEQLGIKYFETSCLTGENVNKAIEQLLELIMDEKEWQAKVGSTSRYSISYTARLRGSEESLDTKKVDCAC